MTAAPAWRHGAGHGRVVAVPVVTAPPEQPGDVGPVGLHPDEQAWAAALSPARRATWIAGRRALRAALAELDPVAAAAPLPVDERGAPVVPAGLVGSISHKRDLAVAIAGLDDGWRLGIDLEQLGPRRIDVAPRVLTAAELTALASVTGGARELAVLRAFSLKEAVYKAIDPYLRRHVGFREVAVWPTDDGAVVVEGDPAWGLVVEAAWWRHGESLVCTARARRA